MFKRFWRVGARTQNKANVTLQQLDTSEAKLSLILCVITINWQLNTNVITTLKFSDLN